MKRVTLAVAVLALAVTASVQVTGAATTATKRTHHFSLTYLGAQPNPDEAVYDVFGTAHGAAVQKLTTNADGSGGTSKSRFYDGHGTTTGVEAYTLSPPDAAGLVAINGTGHYIFGTGRYRHITGRYTFSGVFNTTNGALKVKAVGTARY